MSAIPTPTPRKPVVHTDTISGIRISNRAEAVDALERWSYDRILALSNDERGPVVQHLIQKLGAYGVRVPSFWTEVVQNPNKYAQLHADRFSGPESDEEFLDTRPTAHIESELSQFAG